MRFLFVFTSSKPEGPPSEEAIMRMGPFIEESIKSGKLLSAEGCMPSEKGARVRLSKKKFTVTDGPFTESKEVVGGFAIVEMGSMEEAVEYAKQFLDIGGDDQIEIRQLYEMPATGPT